MPHEDKRTISTADKGKTGAGLRTVTYRDAKGMKKDAVVLGQGTASGLKLRLTSDQNRVVDNVALMTVRTQTNVYIARTSTP
jgi:hypothetical protein